MSVMPTWCGRSRSYLSNVGMMGMKEAAVSRHGRMHGLGDPEEACCGQARQRGHVNRSGGGRLRVVMALTQQAGAIGARPSRPRTQVRMRALLALSIADASDIVTRG